MRAVWSLYLVAVIVGIGLARAVSPACSQQANAVKEAPAPQATAPIALLLENGDKQIQSQHYAQALTSAEQALAAAVSARDDIGEALAQRQRAQALQGLERPEETVLAWKSAADAWKRVGDGPGQVEALGMASLILAKQNPTEASNMQSQILVLTQAETRRPLQMALVLQKLGVQSLNHGNLEPAQSFFKQALALREHLAPGSLDVARSLNNLGVVAFDLGSLSQAEAYHKQALTIREKLAPGSLEVAASLNNLGTIADKRGDLAQTEVYFKQALAIRENLTPGSLEVAASLNNLGVIAHDRGNLNEAEAYHKQSLALREKLAPGSLDVATSLHNLGNIAYSRGNLSQSEDYYKQSLAIEEKLAPNSLNVAESLHNLGNIADEHGDIAQAASYYEQALAIEKKRAPGSLDVAASLNCLGVIAGERGDLLQAELHYKQALALMEQRAPDSLDVAQSLNNLGNVARDRGDLAQAEAYYKRSLAIKEKLAPGSLEVARNWDNLGNVARDRGDLAQAETYYKRSLATREKLAPGSLDVVASLSNMGNVAENEHYPDEAIRNYARSLDILEAQRQKIAGAEARSLLIGKNLNSYLALMRVYASLHQDDKAFLTAERARGRSLSDGLFERQLDFSADVPRGLLSRQRDLDDQRHTVLTERQRLDPNKDKAAFTNNTARLTALAGQQRQLEEEIRLASPKYANLQYPKPLDLPAVQKILAPGTLLLEYAVDTDNTYLFAVTRSGFHLYTLPVKKQDLQKKLDRMYRSVALPGADRDSNVAVQLYDLLIRPAQKEVDAAQRLLICPEGPLHRLPFAALVDKDQPNRPHYLIQSKPLHSIVAMNVYAQLLQERQQANALAHSLLAFGDPAYTELNGEVAQANTTVVASNPVQTAQFEQQNFVRLGGKLERRPITGTQVKAIASMYGSGSLVHVGAEATRSRVLAEGPMARVLHFACHGLLDNIDPLNSRLALTPENAGDDGMLRAYDVMAHLKLHADLVVLGGCQTGLGSDSGAEGIVGLTRAFEYAGAKSVLVSLWEIDANSSTVLLEAFHRYLRAGKSKDEALRLAQMDLIAGKQVEYRDPLHWAAFSLQGDWR